MTYFADLSPCTYFRIDPANKLLAVGWLEAEHEYSHGNVVNGFLERFAHLNKHRWEPYPFDGWHDCSICPADNTPWHGRPPETKSFRNVFVPGQDCVYVATEILPHYVQRHGYAPPEEFQEAVLACPDPEKSRKEYLSLVFNTGPVALRRFVQHHFRRREEMEKAMQRQDPDKRLSPDTSFLSQLFPFVKSLPEAAEAEDLASHIDVDQF